MAIEATADDAEKILRVINNKIKPADVGGSSYTYYTHYKNMRLYYYIDHLRYQQDKIEKLLLTK